MSISRRIRKQENGQSAVEFALVLPILLMLLLGIIEFGWMFNAKITTTAAAREGARVMAVLGDSVPSRLKADAAVRNSLKTTISGDKVTIAYKYVQDIGQPGFITVSVTGLVKPLVGFFYSSDQPMRGEATMRIE